MCTVLLNAADVNSCASDLEKQSRSFTTRSSHLHPALTRLFTQHKRIREQEKGCTSSSELNNQEATWTPGRLWSELHSSAVLSHRCGSVSALSAAAQRDGRHLTAACPPGKENQADTKMTSEMPEPAQTLNIIILLTMIWNPGWVWSTQSSLLLYADLVHEAKKLLLHPFLLFIVK